MLIIIIIIIIIIIMLIIIIIIIIIIIKIIQFCRKRWIYFKLGLRIPPSKHSLHYSTLSDVKDRKKIQTFTLQFLLSRSHILNI